MLASPNPMPRTSDPSKQPQAFYLLMDKVQVAEHREVFVPSAHPASLRGRLQSFFFSLETSGHPRAEEARSLMVRLPSKDDPRVGTGIIVCDRDRSPAAREILAALGQSESGAAKAESDLLRRLGP